MNDIECTLIQQIESRGGRFRLSILKRSDGLFKFQGEVLVEDDEEPFIPFWVGQYTSGLHDTAAAAEREARFVLPWLRAETASEQAG